MPLSMPPPASPPPKAGAGRLRRTLALVLFIALLVLINYGGHWLGALLEVQIFPRHESLLSAAVLASALLYLVLMALPFMPGIEIGLALMMLLGAKGALLVYLITVAALSLSFAIGRLLPVRPLILGCRWLHLRRAANLLTRLEPLDGRQRLALLDREAPRRVAPLVLQYRYLTLALLLNLPGNALIGGGGGISLVAGMSRLIPFHHYLLLVALAVAPIPLTVYFTGG